MAATISFDDFQAHDQRICQLEQALSERPMTYAAADSLLNMQDGILNRLAALEDRLLAPDDQPTADQLSHVTLQAEYDAWQRVNPGAGVVDWTLHFARTRGLGL
jgi:hypothetical protein